MPVSFKKMLQGDSVIWVVVLLLFVISILSVYSATGTLAYRWKQGDTFSYIIRHGAFLISGFACVFVFMLVHYRNYARVANVLFVGSLVLLLLTLIFGVTENDAVRRLSILGMTFQTSDLAKISLVIFVAKQLAIHQEKLDDLRPTVLRIFISIVLTCALILPANLSTAFLVFCAGISLMFIGQIRVKHMLLLCSLAAMLIILFISVSLVVERSGGHTPITGRAVTWVNRISNFGEDTEWTAGQLSDEAESERQLAENYQAEQARIAIGTGGAFGKGPGQSTQRNFLPHPYSDFIYAIIIEEYGIVGGAGVMFLYLLLLYRSALIVKQSERSFPAYLAIGLSLVMVYQAMIHMAVGVGVIPVTGQPLPMVSMGGTSLIFTGISFGMILGVSRELHKQAAKAATEAQASTEQPVPKGEEASGQNAITEMEAR